MKKKFLAVLYWILSLTWGGLMTWVGLLVTGVIIIFFHGKVYSNGFSYIVEVQQCKGGWGLELGAPALASKGSVEGVRKHEFGHSIQNIIWGPLYLFVIGLPSLIRYQYRNWRKKHGKPVLTDYDAIWFEGQATRWGIKAIGEIEWEKQKKLIWDKIADNLIKAFEEEEDNDEVLKLLFEKKINISVLLNSENVDAYNHEITDLLTEDEFDLAKKVAKRFLTKEPAIKHYDFESE